MVVYAGYGGNIFEGEEGTISIEPLGNLKTKKDGLSKLLGIIICFPTMPLDLLLGFNRRHL